jgi:electron transport complex protein RnfE
MPAGWPDWVIMVLPPGAFFTFGLLLAGVNWLVDRREKQVIDMTKESSN